MTKTLVVYFSRTGEQYSVGNITEGNTAIIAKMIAEQTGADMFEVKVKNDTYPTAYKALTEVALDEKKANTRPEIVGDVANFADYDVVFIGTPNWWADMPMAMYTFMEAHDWTGKKIAPFVTHEGSGLSSIPSKIKSTTKADVLNGLAIYGHVAQNSREEVKDFDGFIFGSPVHYAAAGGSITSFMDRVFFVAFGRKDVFIHKLAAAVVSARRAGTTAALDQLNKYFLMTQMPIISGRHWNMVHGAVAEEVKQDLEGLQNMRILARNMAWHLKCQEAAKKAGISMPKEEEITFTNFIR